MTTVKKVILLVLCAALVACASVMGTLAYLQMQTGTIKNTMTVGNVTITLDEAKVTVYGEKDGESRVLKNDYKLIPGHTYLKDPVVHVAANSEACWLFVIVKNEIAHMEAGNTIENQMIANNWICLDNSQGLYVYNGVVASNASQQDIPVFQSFTINSELEAVQMTDGIVEVTAYAVQAVGFATAKDAWNASGFGTQIP